MPAGWISSLGSAFNCVQRAPVTNLYLIHIRRDPIHVPKLADRSGFVDYHHAPVLETPHDDLEPLRDVALDEPRHALAPDADKLVCAQRLREELTAA
jgi:hypothetical protein